jgi:5-methylthioribose kinase
MEAEDLDIENRDALQHYLRANFAPAEEHEIREFRVLAGGVSSRTVLVELAGGQRWVLKQALAKLRVQADWFSDPVRVHREALGMRVLGELVPRRVPKLIFDDERHHVLGMEAVPEPHENWKTMLLAERFESGHFEQFGELLGKIHRRSRKQAATLRNEFSDRSFFESLRIEPYYEYSAAQEPAARDFYRSLIDETRVCSESLVHGDYSPKNILVHGKRLILLDHEVIHWGDPAFDVGFMFTHLLSKSLKLGVHRLLPFVAGTLLCYRAACGEELWTKSYQRRCVRHTLGCMLARVVGRSPLEYLSPEERHRQRDFVLRQIQSPPPVISDLARNLIHDSFSKGDH